jgi:hydrogenase expression/formation protein HypE
LEGLAKLIDLMIAMDDPAILSTVAQMRDGYFREALQLRLDQGSAKAAETAGRILVEDPLASQRAGQAVQGVVLDALGDAAVLQAGSQRLAFATDSFVVRPLFFPGGSIGDLAVNGTVNDLSMSGAVPLWLSVGMIIEEGLPMQTLIQVTQHMAAAAKAAGVQIVTGDTKVVDKGHGDGLYINTSGIGLVPEGVNIAASRAQPGDAIIVSGTIADHGMAVMSVREGLDFQAAFSSDTAALNLLVQDMLQCCPDIHTLRDPTRGGLAATFNEVATASNVGIVLHQNRIPVQEAVQSACEILGLDPLYVASEGRLIACVPAAAADSLLARMRQHACAGQATIIGHVTEQHRGTVVVRTEIGGTRVLTDAIGEQLPRIC